MERKLTVESIYGLGLYPKSCTVEKIINNSFFGPKLLCASLKHIFLITNCSKLVYTMLWHKSSEVKKWHFWPNFFFKSQNYGIFGNSFYLYSYIRPFLSYNFTGTLYWDFKIWKLLRGIYNYFQFVVNPSEKITWLKFQHHFVSI